MQSRSIPRGYLVLILYLHILPIQHCNKLTGHVSQGVSCVNHCMRTVQAKSSTMKGSDKITEKRMGSGVKGHCWGTKSPFEESGSNHTDSNWMGTNVTRQFCLSRFSWRSSCVAHSQCSNMDSNKKELCHSTGAGF